MKRAVTQGVRRGTGEGASGFDKAQPRRQYARASTHIQRCTVTIHHLNGVGQTGAFGIGEAGGRNLVFKAVAATKALVGNGGGQHWCVVGAVKGDVQRLQAVGTLWVHHFEVENIMRSGASGQRVDGHQVVGGVAPDTGVAVHRQGAIDAHFGDGCASNRAAAHAKGGGAGQGAVNVGGGQRAAE